MDRTGVAFADKALIDAVSFLFPWLVDWKSNEERWWVDHQNGRSQGPGIGSS